jgi:hypothetical protein
METEPGTVEKIKVPSDSPLADAPGYEPITEPITPVAPVTPEPPIPGEPAKPVIPSPGGDYTFVHKSVWDQLKKDGITIPPDYEKGKFPEGMTEWDAARDLILENTEDGGPDPDVTDPFIAGYLKQPIEKRDEYVKNYNEAQSFFSLPPTEGLTNWLKSLVKRDPTTGEAVKDKDGNPIRMYTDEGVDKYVEGLGEIQLDKEWRDVQGAARKQFDEYYNRESADQTTKAAERITTENTRRLGIAKTTVAAIDAMNEFGGIPLSQDIKNNAKRDYLLLSQIDPKTGRPYLMNLLNDNKKLMEFVLANAMVNGGATTEYLSSEKEAFAKLLLEEKLDLSPKPKSGSSAPAQGAFLPEP